MLVRQLTGIFMGYIQSESREQLALLPESLDDLIPADHLVRVIELFVEGLDCEALGFARAQPDGLDMIRRIY